MGHSRGERWEFRVAGRLGALLRTAFEDLVVEDLPGETVLRGHLPDQSAVHGVLRRILDLRLELLGAHRVDERDEGPHGDIAAGREAGRP